MISIKGTKSIYNKAEITNVIISNDSVTIGFCEGFEENGEFVSVGADHILLQDIPENISIEGDVITPAITEFTDFVENYNGNSEEKLDYAYKVLEYKKN